MFNSPVKRSKVPQEHMNWLLSLKRRHSLKMMLLLRIFDGEQ